MKDYVENLQGCISKRSEISEEIETIIPKYSKDFREGKSRLDKSVFEKSFFCKSIFSRSNVEKSLVLLFFINSTL